MLLLLLCCSGLVGGVMITEDTYRSEFLKLTAQIEEDTGVSPFDSQGGKFVSSAKRYSIFKTRYNDIMAVNAAQPKYVAVANEFTIMTDEELRLYTGLNITYRRAAPSRRIFSTTEVSSAPDAVDWVEDGMVTDVKAQGICGSCWAFAAVAALESHYAIAGGRLKLMSEQQLVDCTYNSHPGCQGGWMGDAFDAIVEKLGNRLATAATYPYKETEGNCNLNVWDRRGSEAVTNSLVAANLESSSYTSVPFAETQTGGAPYDKNLAAAVAIGPVTVAIQVVNSLYYYGNGIYDETDCNSQVNHAVTVVGYDSKVFLIKNSWGSSWGETGYVRFDRSIKNQCLIATWPEYPNMQTTGDSDGQSTVDPTPCDPNPCLNRGKCVDLGQGGNYLCKCKKKFTGDNCQEKKRDCKDKSDRCPKDKGHKLCLKKGRFVTARCQLSCGFCYL